jgi:nicotinate-nucleotide adenylyltransferase
LRVGILGGTFNPPHLGHLACAQDAHAQLGLDVVVFVPTRVPPHKEVRYDPGAEERLEMTRLAVEKDERFRVSRIELDREPPSYTVDTLRELGDSDELTLIVGGDMARSLPLWHAPREILRRARLGVAERGADARALVTEALEVLPGAEGRVEFFTMPRIDISSTLVRERAAAGQPIRYLVPDEVARHIGARGLYRGAAV